MVKNANAHSEPNLKGYHVTLYDEWVKIRISQCQNTHLALSIAAKFKVSNQPTAKSQLILVVAPTANNKKNIYFQKVDRALTSCGNVVFDGKEKMKFNVDLLLQDPVLLFIIYKSDQQTTLEFLIQITSKLYVRNTHNRAFDGTINIEFI